MGCLELLRHLGILWFGSTPSHRRTDQPLNADRAPGRTRATPSRPGAIGLAHHHLTESVFTPPRPAEFGLNLWAVYLSTSDFMVTKRNRHSYLNILRSVTFYIQRYASPDLSRDLNVYSGQAIVFVAVRSYNVKRRHSTGRHNIPRPWDPYRSSLAAPDSVHLYEAWEMTHKGSNRSHPNCIAEYGERSRYQSRTLSWECWFMGAFLSR